MSILVPVVIPLNGVREIMRLLEMSLAELANREMAVPYPLPITRQMAIDQGNALTRLHEALDSLGVAL